MTYFVISYNTKRIYISKQNNPIIIAITAKAMKDDMEKCIQAGCTDYLPKPIDNQKFIDTLNLWLNNR
jgi:CheY-like chemotaxis protein